MLDVIRLSHDQFDLEGFLLAYARSCPWSSEDDVTVSMCTAGDWNEPPMPNWEQAAPLDILRDGMMLFLTMHEPPVEENVRCTGGGEVDAEELGLGISNCYGWTVVLHDDHLELHPSLYEGEAGPFPRLSPQADCGVMEPSMSEFVKRFVRR